MKSLNLLALILAFCFSLPASAERLVKESQKGSLVYYKGTITVTGEFSRHTDPDSLSIMGDVLCFTAKGASAKLIPRDNDGRSPWFCFSNKKEAMKMLNVPSQISQKSCGYKGKAELTVTRYVADRAETETNDIAQLVRVISSTKPKPIQCN